MAIQLVATTLRSSLPPAHKLVLAIICDCANDQGEEAYPSMARIAASASLSVRQTQRVVKKLTEDGFITVTANATGGAPGDTKRMKVNVGIITENSKDFDKRVRINQQTGDMGVTGDADDTGDMGDARRVTPMTQTGDMGVTLTVLNHPITVNNDEKQNLPEGYEEFWKAAPSKNRQPKKFPKLLSAYRRALKRTSQAILLRKMQEYANSAGVAQGYVKNTIGWLDGDYWLQSFPSASEPHVRPILSNRPAI